MCTTVKKTTAFAVTALVALALALLLGILAVSNPANADPDVAPKLYEDPRSHGDRDGDLECSDLGLGNYEFKLEGSKLQNGTYTDPNNGGYLTVTLSNSVIVSNELMSFDWASNIDVDAVVVKGGTGENAYVYDPPGPESKGDDKLVAPEGKAVSHISFCYDFELKVSKTAQTSLTRTHDWTIDKSVNPSALDLFRGDSGDAAYTVKATRTGSTDSNWAVNGTITVSNPNPFPIGVGGVVDQISGYGPAQVKCTDANNNPVAFPYRLSSGSELKCSYSSPLPDGSNRINTAHAFPVPVEPNTPIVQPGRGTADVKFYNPDGTIHQDTTVTEKNTSISVKDDLGTPDDPNDDKTFPFSGNGGSADPYKLAFNCDEDSGTHTNTASATILNPDGTTRVVSDDASVKVNCYGLNVSKTADTSFTRTQNWDIEKTVKPETLNLFRGDSGEAEYTVKATNTGFTDSKHKVSGTITIKNPAPIAAPLAGVTDKLENGTDATTLDCGDAQSVPARADGVDGQLQCTYSIDLNNAPTDSPNIATVELKNNTGTTTSFSGKANVDFAQATITPVNDSISVSDDPDTPDNPNDDKAFSFSGNGGSETYKLNFDCDEDSAPSTTYKNTATIQQTGQSDGASVTVNCYDLNVSKTADTSLTRTYQWDIKKSVDPETLNLFRGDSGDANYTIDATRTGSKDSDWAVSGTITIKNPAPMTANLQSVTDKLADEEVTVDCGGAQSVPANGQLQCTYSLKLGDASERTNVATATLANGTDFSGTAPVSFSNANINEVNKSVNVDDSNGQSFRFDQSGSERYKLSFDCDEDSAPSKTYDNTATIRETGQSAEASVTVNCYDLNVSKTADTSLTRTYQWTIDKKVDRSTLDLFKGDSGTANYTVSVDKTGSTDSNHKVSGTITIKNPAPIAAPLAGVTDALENGTAGQVSCPAQSVPANGQLQCTYSIDLNNGPTDSPNIATAALKNNTGTTTSFSGKANVDFAQAAITPVNDSISVKDSFSGFGHPRTFSDDGSVSYDRTFDCKDGSKTYENTATIEQTGQSDSASVEVRCHALSVSKDANTSFTRTYDWTIDKSADKSELKLSPGQQFLVNYSVNVGATSTDGDYAVSGKITVRNDTPLDANLKSVSDAVSGDSPIGANVNCGVSFPYKLAAGSTLECSYSAGLPNSDPRTNQATATLANDTDFSGTAPVSFSNATMKEVDEEIKVTDAFNGGSPDTLGVVKASEAPKTFNYTRNIGPYDTTGDRTVKNTAAFVTNDTGTTGKDDWSILVHVPGTGCTLTIGYWKTHAGFTGNNADQVSKYLPIWLGTAKAKKSLQVTTATQAVSIFNKTDSSNGIEKLYAQLLAAKLNIKNGADSSAISSTINDADAFLATYNAANWSTLSKTDQQKAIQLASKLDQYNNGQIGPGHCDEETQQA